jgi:hypothetical protein
MFQLAFRCFKIEMRGTALYNSNLLKTVNRVALVATRIQFMFFRVFHIEFSFPQLLSSYLNININNLPCLLETHLF